MEKSLFGQYRRKGSLSTMEDIGDTAFYENVSALLENITPETVADKGSTALKIGGVIKGFHTAFKNVKLYSSLKAITKSVAFHNGNNKTGGASMDGLWKSILENHKDDKEVIKIIEPVTEKISDTATRADILDALSKIKKTKTNSLFQHMVYQSIAVTVIQFYSLYSAWVFLSRASNVVKNEKEFKKIDECFAEIEKKMEEVRNLMKTDPENRAIEKKINRINTLCSKALKLISETEARIDGRIKKLYLYVDNAVENMTTNTVSLLTEGLQLCLIWDELTLGTNMFGIGVAALRSTVIAGNAYIYYLSQKQLEELQQDQQKVTALKEELDKLQKQIEEITEERDID